MPPEETARVIKEAKNEALKPVKEYFGRLIKRASRRESFIRILTAGNKMFRKKISAILVILFALVLFLPAAAEETGIIEQAGSAISMGQPDRAIEMLDGYIKNNPEDPEAYFLKYKAYYQQEDYQKAEDCFKTGFEDKPGQYKIHVGARRHSRRPG